MANIFNLPDRGDLDWDDEVEGTFYFLKDSIEAEVIDRDAAVTAEAQARQNADALALKKASNLSDVENVATSRTNLGLGTAATKAIGDFDAAGAATAAQAYAVDRSHHTGQQPSSTISDFTESAQDAIAALLQGASGVTLSYDDAANTLTITGGGTGGTGLDEEAVRDAIGVALVGTGLISIVVNDAADTITISTTATQNSTDAALRDRSTHTGVQEVSTVTGLQAALDGKYVKPAGGVPAADLDTAVQASLGKADTATQPADVDAAINSLIDSAPSTLDTLGEIAAALADDDSAIGALTAAVNARIPSTEKGTPDGVATLDADGLVPVEQLPVDAVAFPPDTQLTNPTTDTLYSATVNDDGSPSGSWPNRISHLFKPSAGVAALVTWFNEYFEFRAMPAKVNTVAVRIFSRNNAADTAHSGNVFEIDRTRENRDVVFGVDGEGNTVVDGTLTLQGVQTSAVLPILDGSPVPGGTPANTLIVRPTP